MIVALGWPLLMLCVQGLSGLLFLDRIGKGRLLSRPLWRFRLFAPKVSPYSGYVFGSWTRMMQIFVLIPLNIGLTVTWGSPWLTVGFCLLVICLYADDYYSGDDERWRKFKSRARNAVRWLVPLPSPEPE